MKRTLKLIFNMVFGWKCRQYEQYNVALIVEQRRFRLNSRRRRGQRPVPFPPELAGPKTFSAWLEELVEERTSIDPEGVEADVKCLSKLPSEMATKYRSMWAFGNHPCMAGVEQHLKTCDSCVAATFRRPWRSRAGDLNPVVGDVEYVGQLEEIVELNYRGLCVIVLFCSWVKANYQGSSAIVKKDRWGFTLANFSQVIPFGPKSFAFPMHVEQVYFVEAREDPGWKIVLRKDIRGQRVYGNMGTIQDAGMLAMGNDEQHEGFCAPETIPEENGPRLPTGRSINRDEAGLQSVEDLPLPDLDLGESGSSSEEDS